MINNYCLAPIKGEGIKKKRVVVGPNFIIIDPYQVVEFF